MGIVDEKTMGWWERQRGKWTGEEITERNIHPDEVSEWSKLRVNRRKKLKTRISQQSSAMCTKVLKLKSCLQCNTSSSLFVAYVEQFTHLESYSFLTREVRTNVRRTNQIGRERERVERSESSKKEGTGKEKTERNKNQDHQSECFFTVVVRFHSSLTHRLTLESQTSCSSLALAVLSFLPSCSITRIQVRIWYLWHHGRDQLPSTADPSIRGIQDHIQKHHRSDETCKKPRGHWKLVSRRLIQV